MGDIFKKLNINLNVFIKLFWKTYCYLSKWFNLWKITLSNQLFMFLTFAMVRLLILEKGADVEILIKKPWPVL